MKILLLADLESKSLWDFFQPEKLEGIDLIISCGDLNPQYLSFLATFTTAPVLYIHGNHDERYEKDPPEGCTCIDDEIYEYQGIRILGLGGCKWYNGNGHQYTEQQMQKRIRKLRFKLWRKKGFDILIAHAPAYHLHDGEDPAHQGFVSFLNLMDRYHPKIFAHGHVHLAYGREYIREDDYHGTRIINAYEKYLVEI